MRVSIRAKLVALILLLILSAIGLLSYKSLSFFSQDKEAYVYDLINQVVNVQSTELDRKLVSLERMLQLFDDFSRYPLQNQERQRFLSKYEDFIYIGNFNVAAGRLSDKLVIADRGRLQQAGFNTQKVKSNRRILDTIARGKRFTAINVTQSANNPVVALVHIPKKGQAVLGILSQNRVLDVGGRKKVYTSYVVDASGDLLMHQDGVQLLSYQNLNDQPLVQAWLKNPKLPQTREFTTAENNKALGAYTSVRNANFGLFIEVPKEQAFLAAKRLIKSSSLWAVLIFVLSCIIGILFAYTLTRPVKALAAMTRKVAKGDFSVHIKQQSNDELGELVNSFNHMSQELDVREKKLEEAHEQLVQSEKMSAFGQMSAGIAHEVKNPLAGILGYAQLAKRKIEAESPITKYMDTIEKETKRCKDIIENLMKFARQEESEFDAFPINQTVKDTIALVDHQLSINGVKIVQEIGDENSNVEVVGNANQIQQVLMNLMLNAQHAMEDGGTLTVSSLSNGNQQVEIKVSDTGHGIESEHLKKIFEPFFTTKEAGKGTGLGLAVSYGIIQNHKGDISAESEIGKGTTFIIHLPTADSPEAPEPSLGEN